ncbi:hypothetical protein CANINC_002832 [Pichia inconspicua]|uniref:Ribonuclease P/MRP protein subunit POP5 n=1 Tax=Pichia inconspicua TaxID=52247 RepID=A0A4T0X1D5_9ASCO|nr:hypothetical protein CANINC_002832 [[Candida] inconspicua]
MVRLKTRYILFQIRHGGEEESGFVTNAKSIISTIRLSMMKNFGDIGVADTLTTFAVKYFSTRTMVGILRVHFEAIERVLAAMFFVQAIDGKEIIMETIGVSGSISKCERRAIERNRKIIRKYRNKGLEIEEEPVIIIDE